MNAVFYWCGCRKGFEGDEPPEFCGQHNDGVSHVVMDKVEEVVEEEEAPPEVPPEVPPEEPKLKPKTKASKR